MNRPAMESAEHLLRAGCLDEAEAAILAHLRSHPQSAPAYELLGLLYLEQRRYDLAVDACTTAVTIDPDRRQAYQQLARAQRGLGRIREALDSLLLAIGRHPQHTPYYLDAALVLRDSANLDKALDLLALARERCPETAWQVDHLELEMLHAADRPERVVALASRLVAADPSDTVALEHLAESLSRLGDQEAAIAVMCQLVVCCPSATEFELRLAELLRDHGQFDRAVPLFERVIDRAGGTDAAAVAWDALMEIDEEQLPTVITLATESRLFWRQLQIDPHGTLLANDFHLSHAGLATLVTMLTDLTCQAAGPLRHH